ncbi:unnamed protein product [Dibothriocephalus latus]|uniref:Uncharacterized protein n=1 Tax=Dibothriocephalus latus TaxID=60516 RepID=A0A3P7KYA4_DIBLA|nr:unnamed protein product [Dibothriocephalus latus]
MSSIYQMWKIFEAQQATIIDLLAMLQEDVKQTGSDLEFIFFSAGTALSVHDRMKRLEDMITRAKTETTTAATDASAIEATATEAPAATEADKAEPQINKLINK